MSLPFSPGSTPWLLANELRLSFRGTLGAKEGVRRYVILAVIMGAGAFLGGVPVALGLQHTQVRATPILDMIVAGASLLLFSFMLAQGLLASTMALYERNDLDLLLSAPLPPRRVLAVRAVAIAITVSSLYLILGSMFLVPLAVIASPYWLLSFLYILALGLVATAGGLSLAMGLFAVIGPRATKTVAQVMAALIGAAMFLLGQAQNIFPELRREWMAQLKDIAGSNLFDPDQPLAWPARAFLGEPLPLAVVAGAGLAFFLLVVWLLGRRFADNAAAAIGAMSAKRARKSARADLRPFPKGPLAAVVSKELRLLRRDAWLISQVLIQGLYVIPLALAFWRTRHSADLVVASAAAIIVFFAGQFAANLAWIAISAEDSPDLIAVSPVPAALVRRGKLIAALIPVAMLLSIPLGLLAWVSPWIAVIAGVGGMSAATGSGLIQLWWQKPANRKDFRRRRQGSILVAFAEFAWLALCGFATWLAAVQQWAFVVPAIVAIGLLVLLRRDDKEPA